MIDFVSVVGIADGYLHMKVKIDILIDTIFIYNTLIIKTCLLIFINKEIRNNIGKKE